MNDFLIRLTNFCNETCSHCVFRSGPKFDTHMTEDTAQQINEWMPKNGSSLTLTGGELTLIPHYPTLIRNLCQNFKQAGMVTNGVFVRNMKDFDRLVGVIIDLPIDNFTIRVSQSQYHSSQNGLRAYDKLRESMSHIKGRWIQKTGHIDHIVPFGRAFDNSIGLMPTHPTIMPGAICEDALRNSLFIDEQGFTHLCPMGSCRHKHVSEDSHSNIRKEIEAWQKHKIDRGMTCLSCSSKNIGYSASEIVTLRTKSTTTCPSGLFNGAV